MTPSGVGVMARVVSGLRLELGIGVSETCLSKFTSSTVKL